MTATPLGGNERDRAGEIGVSRRAGLEPYSGRARAPWLPLAFVIFSLLALVVLPTVEGRIVSAYQERLREVAQPARRLLAEMQLSLTLGRSGGPRPGRWTAIGVRDTGAGIPEHQLDTIFEEFTRGENHDVPGAGLGLAIARRIARLLGGDVTLTTEVSKGSTFTFWLPR